jgi:hypothetical protein
MAAMENKTSEELKKIRVSRIVGDWNCIGAILMYLNDGSSR